MYANSLNDYYIRKWESNFDENYQQNDNSENQMTNFNKQCFQLDTLEAAFNGKCPELVNRKMNKFISG